MAGLRSQALGHAARLLHARLAPAERQNSAHVLHLAKGLMSAGVDLVDDLDGLVMLKRYLPGLLKALSMQHSDVRHVGQPTLPILADIIMLAHKVKVSANAVCFLGEESILAASAQRSTSAQHVSQALPALTGKEGGDDSNG